MSASIVPCAKYNVRSSGESEAAPSISPVRAESAAYMMSCTFFEAMSTRYSFSLKQKMMRWPSFSQIG